MENAKVVVELVDGEVKAEMQGAPLLVMGMLEVAMFMAAQKMGIRLNSDPQGPTPEELEEKIAGEAAGD